MNENVIMAYNNNEFGNRAGYFHSVFFNKYRYLFRIELKNN